MPSPPPKRVKLESSPTPPPDDAHDDDKEHCIICLQDIVDRTTLPACAHDRFCFECVVVWTEQSRKCPLCQQAIGSHLVHHVRSKLDFSKFYLPPLRSSPLPDHPRPPRGFRQPNTRAARARVWGRREDRRGEEAEQRAIDKRRWVYRHDLFAKHVASNSHTKYRPYPTPAQFATQPDLITRTTAFVRRELAVWDNVDADFLTSFVISLMKSLDLRSEVAIKLLSEFLDMGNPYVEGNRYPNAEHFAHEVYSYIRSPFREIAVYDAHVQYDAPPDGSPPFDENTSKRRADIPRPVPAPRARPPLNVNESLSGPGFHPPTRSRSRDRRPPRRRSRSRSRRKRSRSDSPPRTSRARSRDRSPRRRSPSRGQPRSRRRIAHHHSPSPVRSPSPARSPSLQQSPSPRRSSSPQEDPVAAHRSSESPDDKHGHVDVVTSTGDDEVPARRQRASQRAPRQTALSSIHAHLGARPARRVAIDRRPLAERFADDAVPERTVLAQGNDAPPPEQEDRRGEDPPERLSTREIMARTRARLEALKAQTNDADMSSGAPQSNALREMLLARLEEEKKKLAVPPAKSDDAEERRLRLAAKLAAEKRRASLASSSRVAVTVE